MKGHGFRFRLAHDRRRGSLAALVHELVGEFMDENGGGVRRRQGLEHRNLSRSGASVRAAEVGDPRQVHAGVCDRALKGREVNAGIADRVLREGRQGFPVRLEHIKSNT